MTIPPAAAGRITRQHGAPAVHAERVGGLAQAAGDEQQHLLAGARDQRQHHDRQRDRAGEARLLVLRDHDQPVDEQPDHDRRDALHHVERELEDSRRARPRAGELGQVEPGEDPQRQGDHRRCRDDLERPEQRVGDPAARPAPVGWWMTKPRLSAAAPRATTPYNDDHQHCHRGQRGGGRDDLNEPVDPGAPAQVARTASAARRVERRGLAQRDRSRLRSCRLGQHPGADVEPAGDRPRRDAAEQRDHHQDEPGIEHRGGVQGIHRRLELSGDLLGDGGAGLEQRSVDLRSRRRSRTTPRSPRRARGQARARRPRRRRTRCSAARCPGSPPSAWRRAPRRRP